MSFQLTHAKKLIETVTRRVDRLPEKTRAVLRSEMEAIQAIVGDRLIALSAPMNPEETEESEEVEEPEETSDTNDSPSLPGAGDDEGDDA